MQLAKSSNAKKGDDIVETSTNSTNEVHSTLSLDGNETEHEFVNENEGGEEYNGTIDVKNWIITNETNNDLYTNRLKTNDTSTFTNEVLIHYDDESRLQSLLDESNRTLIENNVLFNNGFIKMTCQNLKLKG